MGPGEQLVREFFAALSSGDLEALAPFVEEATWTMCAADILGAGSYTGRAILDDFLGPVRGLFVPGDPKVEVVRVAEDGPLVAVEARGRGSFRNGTLYDNRYAFWFEVEGGRIRAIREYMDTKYAHEVVQAATA